MGNTKAAKYNLGCGGECVDSLNCPYEVCLHDQKDVSVRTKQAEARREKVAVLWRSGMTYTEMAKELGVQQRTIARDVAEVS